MPGDLSMDTRYALRGLRRNPGFAAAAMICLALGIGAVTAIFTVVNAIVLRPLPYQDPDSLVRVYTEFPTFPNGGLLRFAVSGPEFLEMRRDASWFQTLDAWGKGGVNLSGSEEPVRAQAAIVSGTLLETLGVKPLRGRILQPADDIAGAPLTVVISEGLWRRAFGADASMLNREIVVDSRKATVVGIMPLEFQFPPGDPQPAEVWVPLQLNPASPGNRGGHRFALLGRLRQGVSLDQARNSTANLVTLAGKAASPNHHVLSPDVHPVVIHPLHGEVVGNVRPALLALLAAVVFVLLIACGNVANLLLARAQARQKEIAVRRAMGASTLGLARQFLLEGFLLSLGGAIGGLILAWFGLRALLALGSASIPRSAEVALDLRVLLATLAVSVITSLFFGLAPLLQAVASRIYDTLKSAGGRTTATREAHRLRTVMIVGESALALILLAGAGFMIDAFWRMRQTDVGIRPDNTLTIAIDLPRPSYPDAKTTIAFWDRLQQRVAVLPGVISASIADGLPPLRPLDANDTEFENFVPTKGGPIQNVDYWQVAGYKHFETLGMRLIEGRFLDERDGPDAPPVLVVNERLARLYYPGQSALGKRIRPGMEDPWRTVVGVVADVKNGGMDRPAGTELWFPFRQIPERIGSEYLLVKTAGEPKAMLSAVRNEVAALDPTLPLSSIRTMQEVVDQAQARPRFLTLLLTLFSAIALLLAALGLYSVMSYAVAQRTNEFGVRMAMGAGQSDVLRAVLGQGFAIGGAGMALGSIGAIVLNRLLRDQMYGLGDFRWLPFTVTALCLMLVLLTASWVPAMRATRVDPMKALRYE